MSPKQYLAAATLLSLFLATGAFAQTKETRQDPAPQNPREALKDRRLEERQKMDIQRDALKEKRLDIKDDIKEKRDEVKTELKTRREALAESIKEKREALKLEIDRIKKERVTARKGFVEERLRTAIRVVTERQERVDAAIKRLKERNIDTAIAEESLKLSKSSRDEARQALEKLSALSLTDTDKAKLESARGYAKTAETALRASREHLVKAIQLLREAVADAEDKEDNEEESEGDN